MPTFFNQKTVFWREAIECLCGALTLGVITFVCFRFHFQLQTPTLLCLLVIVFLSLRGSFVSSAVVSVLAAGCLLYFFVTPIFTFKIVTVADFVAISVFLTTSAIITHLVSRVRRLMQDKLQRSEAYLSEAQALSHTGSFGWKVPTGELVWSEETFRILAYDRNTRPTLELFQKRVHPDDSTRSRHIIECAAKSGEDFEVELRLLMPEGSVKFIQIVAHALKEKSDEFEFVGALMDITERRKAEEALYKAQASLAHVTRLTMMGELTASIAHEVNQPMAAVVTNANAGLRWLDREVPNLAEARDALRRIVLAGTRGGEVIARVRNLTKKELPARLRLDLNEVVRETIALAHLDLRRVRLTTDLVDGLPNVQADRVQLQQVLLNLILNALDAMENVTDRPCELRIETRNQGNRTVHVAVSDSGIGMNASQREHLFEAFYTTKPDGLGLGLSICRSIVEAHGGRLWVESSHGPGTTFQFTLPVEGESQS